MLLPGRLKDTTLGDVLGIMLRARATGTLILSELRPTAGRKHTIQVERGQIVGVETNLGPTVTELLAVSLEPEEIVGKRVGDALRASGRISNGELKSALHEQLKRKIDRLFSIVDAEIRFRVPRPATDDDSRPAPLGKEEFLVGRPRAKLRTGRTLEATENEPRLVALRVLGLSSGATRSEIQSAFRRLALSHHPDRLAHPSEREKTDALRRFAEISRAYHDLTG